MLASQIRLPAVLAVLTLIACISAGCQDDAPAQPSSTSTSASAGAAADGALVPDAAAEPAVDEDMIHALPDFPVTCTASFNGAKHEGEAGSMSTLDFVFKLEQEGSMLKDEQANLSAQDLQASAQFELPDYQLNLSPVIDPPIKLEDGQYGSYGGYQISLAGPDGGAWATLEVDKTGKIAKADGANGYQLNILLAAPYEQLYSYSVIPPGGSVSGPAMALSIHVGEFESQEAADSAGGSYDYRFPGLELTLYGPQLASNQEYIRAADNRAVGGGTRGGGGGGGMLGRGGGRGGGGGGG